MKRPQFSLRTALLATTLLAFPMGWIASKARESMRQNSVAAQLEQMGAVVQFEGELLPKVTAVYLTGPKNVDDAIALIGTLPNLVDLTLQSAEFSDDQLIHLVGLKELESVDLKWTTITDDGLAHLANIPSIRSLKLNKSYPPNPMRNVSESQLTDASLRHIAKLSKLDTIVFWGADLSDRGLSEIAKCEHLKVVWLCDTDIDGTGLSHLRGLSKLEKLDLCGTKVTASSLEPLKALPRLVSLSVARTNVTPQDALQYQASRSGTFSIGY